MSLSYQSSTYSAARASVDERAQFLVRTYNHLFLSIVAFAGIEVALFKSELAYPIASAMLGVNWLFVLGGFMVVSWFASRAAHNAQSLTTQYLALSAFVVGEAIIFVPLLVLADSMASGVIQSAGMVTLLGFGGLTAVAFVTKKDFSFLRGFLMWGGILAMVFIAAGALFGFSGGTFFSVAMVGFAGASILYDTSNVIHHYPTNRYVGASLELFASVALMFWYILRIFMASSRD
jgi:FtsH-binding integral membrane protein